jgi:NAD(P)-dependent dehydrogenase (short-subunit alcohol dehydrogenase family)
VAEAVGAEAALETMICDVGELDQIDRLAEQLRASGPVDTVVHNAGALLHELTRTSAGHEVTLAVHVLGPLRLTARLESTLQASDDARVIWVTSGGMYLQPLERAVLLRPDAPGAPAYDGVKAYARAKRAQVVLNRLLAERLGPAGVLVAAMHPGWADTPGVQRALPAFRRMTRAILRDADEGADSALWLAAAPRREIEAGRLYLDRVARQDALFPGTATSADEAAALWRDLCALAEVDWPVPGASAALAGGTARGGRTAP